MGIGPFGNDIRQSTSKRVLGKQQSSFYLIEKNILNSSLVIEILEKYERQDALYFLFNVSIYFAQLTNNSANLLEYHLEKKHFSKCLEVLSLEVGHCLISQENIPLIYSVSDRFFEINHVDFIGLCMKHSNIDPKRIISSMVDYELLAGHRVWKRI